MGEPPRLTVVFSLLLLVLENSRLVSPRMDRPESTLSLPTPLESSSSSLLATRCTPLSHPTARPDLRKSPRKSATSSRRLDITQLLFHSSQFLDGMETT